MSVSTVAIEKYAQNMRRNIVKMITLAGSGHPGGSLGVADIFAALFFDILKYDSKNSNSSQRDLLVLSAGHLVPAYYAALAEAGLIKIGELKTFRQFGSRLQGHPERMALPWLEATSGPLGCGLGEAAGMAWAIRDNSKRFVYCICGDGELDEGNIWESAMFAAKYNLGNLVLFVDRNNMQLSGESEDVMPLENLREKWESFNWHVQEIDGNNVESIISAASLARAETKRPSVIIAHTTMGKGVSFMEDDYHWHGKAPSVAEMRRALEELK